MKYGLVVFDFDGTLADSFPWFAGAINQLADRYKFNRVAPHEFDTLRRWDSQTILKHLRVPFWKIPLMGAHMRALMNQNIQHIHPFAGVQQLLPLLAERGAKLGMVSSNSFENIQLVLGADNARLFTYCECWVSIWGKPGRLRKILRQSCVPPKAAIYIGDEMRDMEAARAVGMRSGAVAWGYAHLDALQTRLPDEIFLHVNELSDRLTK